MFRRLILIVPVAILAVGGLLAVSVGPAGATIVSTEAELRAAFGNPAETLIDLANDITLTDCSPTGGDLDRDSATALTLRGPGLTLRQQCEEERVLEQAGTGALNFEFITITNGDLVGFSSDLEGGGVRAGGNVTITESFIFGNRATGQNPRGGGVFAVGNIFVSNSTIAENWAFDPGDAIEATGGGLFTQDGDITINGSVIMENLAQSPLYAVGGGFWTISGNVTVYRSSVTGNLVMGSDVVGGGGGTQNGSFQLIDSTVAGNTANGGANGNAQAAGMRGAVVTVTNSTVSGNEATAQDTRAGGVRAEQLTLVYATVIGNTGEESSNVDVSDGDPTSLTVFGSVIALGVGGPNCDLNSSTTVTNGYNDSDDASCGLIASNDVQNGANPLLGALVNNRGATPTQVPEGASPLLDRIPTASCQSGGATGIVADQRSLPRPSGIGCDVGAVEVQVATPPVPVPAPTPPAPEPVPTPVSPSFTG